MSAAQVTVGIDLGTSSLKAVVRSAADGAVLARARHGYPTRHPEPGAAEQDPLDWWRAVAAGTGELAGAVPVRQWAAIGLSGMLPTLVALDAHRQPVGPAITWEDGRGEAAAARLRERVGGEQLYRRTGQWVDGRYLLPMVEALLERRPQDRDRVQIVSGAKDYLFARLTDQLLTDPSTAAGYGCYRLADGGWDGQLADGRTLPEVRPATTAVPLGRAAADQLGLPVGLPVAVGAADSVSAAYAVGASRPGDTAYLCGTSTAVLGLRDRVVLDERHRYLVTPTADGAWAAETDLLATGSALSWLADLLGLPGGAAAVAELAEQVEPGWPAFLPYVAPGEQGALWDADLRGAVLGLHARHGRSDLARALLSGIVVESVRCLRLLDAAGEVRAAGRMVRRPFAQDLADATGCAVRFDPAEPEHSALGAAMLAAAAVGLDAAPAAVPVAVEPRPDRLSRWQELFDRHDRLREVIGHAGSGASDDR